MVANGTGSFDRVREGVSGVLVVLWMTSEGSGASFEVCVSKDNFLVRVYW